jgi:CDP-glycerol glycerophosphotransferase (TagB/SpsB family)
MIQAIDENFNLHASKIPGITEGMKVFRTENLTYIDSGLSCDTFNIIHITNGLQISINELADTIRYYKDRSLAFCIWVNEQNLTLELKSIFDRLGLKEQNKEPGMVLKLEDYPLTDNPLHHKIIVVDSAERIGLFARSLQRTGHPPTKTLFLILKRL